VRRDSNAPDADVERVIEILLGWIAEDRKATPLKALQGMVWEQGYQAGQLKGHVYPDAVEALKHWHQQGLSTVCLFLGLDPGPAPDFRLLGSGDLTPLFSGYFDTTSGPKREAQSYTNITQAIGLEASQILFLSDIVEELDAAQGRDGHVRAGP
jgi:enolase-phosphatase E1